jgi:hypothetical protein
MLNTNAVNVWLQENVHYPIVDHYLFESPILLESLLLVHDFTDRLQIDNDKS